MNAIFLSDVPDSKGTIVIQKLYASITILATSSFNQYVLLKISDNIKILCKIVPQLMFTEAFASCDPSVLLCTPNKLINPSTVKLDISINKDNIKPIAVANARSIEVSVVFKDVNNQNMWSGNLLKLSEAIKNVLQLFVVCSDSIVSLKRLSSKQCYNIDYILIHKTDCKNKCSCITPETIITIIKTMSTIQFYHAEIGLQVQPFFGMETHVSRLKNIIRAARNDCNNFCNMV